MNWLGDVAMPIGVLTISLLASAWIASASVKASRQTVIFQHDLQYAEEFLAVLQPAGGRPPLLNGSERDSLRTWSEINQARVRFTSRVSGSADLALSIHLSRLEQTIWAVQRRFYDRMRAVRDTGVTEIEAYDTALKEYRSEHSTEALRAFDEMVRAVRDWPFPESRSRILREVAESTVANWHSPPTDVDLAIARQMLNLRPSRARVVHRARAFWLEVWGWADTIRFGGARERMSAWYRGRQEGRPWRGHERRQREGLRQVRREAIALRQLQETAQRHYASTGRVAPFELQAVPRRPRRKLE